MTGILILSGAGLALLIAYLTYGFWLSKKWGMNPRRKTPAAVVDGGGDYAASSGPVVFGQYFSSITGPGMIHGTVLGAVFGWMPVLLWIVLGSVFLGAVQSFGAFVASMRHKGKTLGTVIGDNISARAKAAFLILAWMGVIFIIAAFGDIVVKSFTGIVEDNKGNQALQVANGSVAMAGMLMIPVSIFWGYLNRLRCPVFTSTIIGLILLGGCVLVGLFIPLYLPGEIWKIVILVYLFLASLLPVWFLLQPRDYLSSWFVYILLIAAVAGLFLVRPEMKLPAFGGWTEGNHLLFPYLFVTVLSGAASGYHGLAGSGIAAKQLGNERNQRAVGYGAILLQAFLAIVVLVIIGSFGNTESFGQFETPLELFSASLLSIFDKLGVKSSWESPIQTFLLLVLTSMTLAVLDTAVRLGRTLLQELFEGSENEQGTLGGKLVCTIVTLCAAAGLSYSGYQRIWPVLGIWFQLLSLPLCLGIGVWLKKSGKKWKMLLLPMIFLGVVSVVSAGIFLADGGLALVKKEEGASFGTEGVQCALLILALLLVLMILIEGVRELMKKREIIFATGNEGKMKEIREIMADVDVTILSLKEAKITADIEEDGDTFVENAIIKAKAISQLTKKLVLADDSGLEIDYLDKEPGVYSARYMGEDTPYDVKNASLLKRLEGVPREERGARFVCAIAAVYPDGEVVTAEGIMEGYIGWQEQGSNGFGYDPIFYIEEFDCSSAELDMEQKNKISHRGKALRAMKEKIV